MNKEYLLNKTENLKSISQDELGILKLQKDILVSKLNEKILSRDDVNEMIGINNINLMKDNHANHMKFMLSIFEDFQASVFVNTVIWVFKAYRSRGFQTTYWSTQLNAWLEVFKDNLPEEVYREVYPFYEYLIVHIPDFVSVSEQESEITFPNH